MSKKLKTKNSVKNSKANPMMVNLLDFISDKPILFHEDFELESRKQEYKLKR